MCGWREMETRPQWAVTSQSKPGNYTVMAINGSASLETAPSVSANMFQCINWIIFENMFSYYIYLINKISSIVMAFVKTINNDNVYHQQQRTYFGTYIYLCKILRLAGN